MTPDRIQSYIQIAMLLASAGVDIVGKMKALIALFQPGHTLTDAQINAIEQAGIADSLRRMHEREAMGGGPAPE